MAVRNALSTPMEQAAPPHASFPSLSLQSIGKTAALTAVLIAGAMDRTAAAEEKPTQQTTTDTGQSAEKSESEMMQELTAILSDRFHYRTLMLWTQPPEPESVEKLKTDIGRVFGLKHDAFLMTVLYPKDGRVTVMLQEPAQKLKPVAVFAKERLQDIREFRQYPKLTELDKAQLNIVSRQALDLNNRMGSRRTVAEATETEDGATIVVMDAETKTLIGKIIHTNAGQEMSIDENAMSILTADKTPK